MWRGWYCLPYCDVPRRRRSSSPPWWPAHLSASVKNTMLLLVIKWDVLKVFTRIHSPANVNKVEVLEVTKYWQSRSRKMGGNWNMIITNPENTKSLKKIVKMSSKYHKNKNKQKGELSLMETFRVAVEVESISKRSRQECCDLLERFSRVCCFSSV